MENASDTSTTDTDTTGFDFDKAADSIGADLGLGVEEEVGENPVVTEALEPSLAEPTSEETPAEVPSVRTAPKTWPKEMHEHWSKLDPKVHDYLELREKQMLDGLTQYKDAATFAKSMHDVGTEFKQDLDFNKVDMPTAFKFLLNANRQLTTGPQESRIAAYRDLGHRLGLSGAATEQTDPNHVVDPAIKQLQDELYSIKSGLTAQQQAAHADAKGRVTKEVESFWSDPAHAYADEVASDMVPFIQSGASLQDAYDKAVWANPVTRAKEQAKAQTAWQAKQQENARLAALPKKQAAGVNVKGRDTRRAPTEPLGGIEDTIKSTLADMKARV